MNTSGILVTINGVDTKIEYTDESGIHVLGLWDTPFKAIQNGDKKIEVRTNTTQIPFDFNAINEGDKIKFVNELTGETLLSEVVNKYHYKSTEEYLNEHGFKDSSAKPKNMAEAIHAIEKHTGYKDGIKNHGLFAFRFRVIQNFG